jgi:hypothetical protein
LPQLDPSPEMANQIPDQRTKIDALFAGEEKHDPALSQHEVDFNQFHRKTVLVDQVLGNPERLAGLIQIHPVFRKILVNRDCLRDYQVDFFFPAGPAGPDGSTTPTVISGSDDLSQIRSEFRRNDYVDSRRQINFTVLFCKYDFAGIQYPNNPVCL